MAITTYPLFNLGSPDAQGFDKSVYQVAALSENDPIYLGGYGKLYKKNPFDQNFTKIYDSGSKTTIIIPIVFNGKIVIYEKPDFYNNVTGYVKDQVDSGSPRIIGKIPDYHKLYGIENINNRLYFICSGLGDNKPFSDDRSAIYSIDDTPTYEENPSREFWSNDEELGGYVKENGNLYFLIYKGRIDVALQALHYDLYELSGSGLNLFRDNFYQFETDSNIVLPHFVNGNLRCFHVAPGNFNTDTPDTYKCYEINGANRTLILQQDILIFSVSQYNLAVDDDYVYLMANDIVYNSTIEQFLFRYKKSDSTKDLTFLEMRDSRADYDANQDNRGSVYMNFGDVFKGFGDRTGKFRSFDQPPVLEIFADIDNFDVDITVVGGVPGYVYQWSDGAQTEDRTNLAPGQYSVTVTDSLGNTATLNIDLSLPYFEFSKNPVILPLEAADFGNKDNLTFVCDVEVESEYKSNNFEKVITLEQPADDQGKTTFNVAAVLDAVFRDELPSLNDSLINSKTDSFFRYRLRYAEKYGDPPIQQPSELANTFFIIKGGLSKIEFAKKKFFEQIESGKLSIFMDWNFRKKKQYINQYDFISFILLSDFSEVSMRAIIKYSDGSTFETNILNAIANPVTYELYQIPASLIQLGLSSYYPAKEITGYELRLYDDASNPISDPYVFELYKEKATRQFLYLNSLGAWNVAAFKSNTEIKISSKEETISINLGFDYTPTTREEEIVRKFGDLDDKVFAGYFTKPELEKFMTFILSRNVYEIIDGEMIPVIIQTKTTIRDDFEKIIPLEFDVIKPSIENFTPQL